MSDTENIERLTPLAPRLARHMTPLAFLTFAVMGGVAPWLYQQSQEVELKREASFMSQAIATRFQHLVIRAPELWAYHPREIAEISKPFQALGAQIDCQTAHGTSCAPLPLNISLRRSAQLERGQRDVVSANAPVMYRRREVGRISVSLARPTKGMPLGLPLDIWWFSTPLSLLVAGLIIMLPRRAARAADGMNASLWRRLLELNTTLEQRVSTRTQELSEMNQRLLTVQEDERQRISRDLHDELGQTLTGLRLQLTCAEITNRDQQVGELITRSLEIIDLGVDQVRRIAYEQRPPELDMLGLRDALHALVRRAELSSNATISLNIGVSPTLDRLPSELNVSLFRIAQEGITNALRHSDSNIVEVRLALMNTEVVLEVVDHGSGVASDLIWGGGLSGAHGRIHKLGGQLIVKPTRGGGVTLCVRVIPLEESRG